MRHPIKNVVFIILDTLQFNYLGCYGNTVVKTPNFDKFAAEGLLFENAYSEGLPTIPVRRAVMTGRFTLPFGGWQPLSAEDTTIADMLWGRNIETALIYDTAPMRLPKYAYARGFDYVKFCPGHEMDHITWKDTPKDPALKPEDFTAPSMVWDKDGNLIDDASTALLEEIDCYLRFRQGWKSDADSYVGVVAREAREWLVNRRDKKRPFLLWLDSFDPHEPWDPASIWEKKPCPYDPEWDGNPLLLAPWTKVEGRISERECEHIRALYAEKVTQCDAWIGRVVDTLKQEGLWDETLVVIMSDHGQPMGNGKHGHGIMRKCRPWPYEELVHVPLLMYVPGTEGGRRISTFVQNVDVGATIMDAFGLLAPEAHLGTVLGIDAPRLDDVQGISLLPLARGETDHVRDYVITGYCGMSWSIVDHDYSYIHWLNRDPSNAEFDELLENPYGDDGPSETIWTCTTGATQEVPSEDELYDRRTDPFQLHNIAAEQPEKARELLKKLKASIGEIRIS